MQAMFTLLDLSCVEAQEKPFSPTKVQWSLAKAHVLELKQSFHVVTFQIRY